MAGGFPFPAQLACSGQTDGGGGCYGGGTCYAGAGNGLPSPDCVAYLATGAFCGCLAGSELVNLWDGTTKPASEIRDGDLLLGFDASGERAPQAVSRAYAMVQPCLEIAHERGTLVCSMTHVLIDASGQQVTASGLCEDEHRLLAEDGESVAILSLRQVGALEVFGWTCEPDHVFVAAGLVHHNKAGLLAPFGAVSQ